MADPIPIPSEATLTVLAAVSANSAGVSVIDLTLFDKYPLSMQGNVLNQFIVLSRIEYNRGHRECITHHIPTLVGIPIAQPYIKRVDIVGCSGLDEYKTPIVMNYVPSIAIARPIDILNSKHSL